MKRMRHVVLLLVTAVLCLGVIAAQETAKKTSAKTAKKATKSESAMPMGMPMPKPSPEMEKLSKMIVGTWATAETFDVSEMMPKGGKGHGTAVVKAGPGGLMLMEDYHSKGGMGAFAGHGVFWWDDKAQGYRSVWCDNTTPSGCSVENGVGKWEGDQLVWYDEQEMMGKKEKMREVMAGNSSSFMFTMNSSEDGGPEKRVMTIKYTKAAAKPAATPAGN